VNALLDIGVASATAKSMSGKVTVEFDPNVVTLEQIFKEIEDLDFRPIPPKATDG